MTLVKFCLGSQEAYEGRRIPPRHSMEPIRAKASSAELDPHDNESADCDSGDQQQNPSH